MDNKHTHHKEIKRWANCPDGTEVYIKDTEIGWILSKNVKWISMLPYIVNDKFAKYRKAIIDGKAIEVRYSSTNRLIKRTEDIHDLAFCDEMHLKDKVYIIVEKVNFNVGDYVLYEADIYHIEDKDDEYYYLYKGTSGDYSEKISIKDNNLSKWKPEDSIGIYCWFWDNDSSALSLSHLDGIDRDNEGYNYIRKGKVYYENIAPYLGFIPNVLKD